MANNKFPYAYLRRLYDKQEYDSKSQKIAIKQWYNSTEDISSGGGTRGMAFDGTNIWVTNYNDGTISCINARTGIPVTGSPFVCGTTPIDVTYDGTYIYVSNATVGTVTQLDAVTGAQIRTISVGTDVLGIYYDGNYIWAALPTDGEITKFNSEGIVASGFPMIPGASNAAEPQYITSDGISIWVSFFADDEVRGVDPSTGFAVATITLAAGAEPAGLVYDGGYVWVANSNTNTVTKINPRPTASIVGTYSVGTTPLQIAFDNKYIYVSNSGSSNVSRLQLDGSNANGPISVTANPWGCIYDGNSIWVTSGNNVTKIE